MVELPPWSLPLIVAAIAVPIIAGFLVAGPALGLAVGALAATALIVLAARQKPREQIRPTAAQDHRRHVLVALSRPVESPEAVAAIAEAVGANDPDAAGEILVLAPATSGFLDRWATDVRRARTEAQRKLVISVASLARADLDARAQVGDADLVQAVEDSLGSFPATKVLLATGNAREDRAGARAAAELDERLGVPFEHLVLD